MGKAAKRKKYLGNTHSADSRNISASGMHKI